MKIRNGFVTNSSSSSFIVSVHGAHENEPLVRFFKYMCDEYNYEFPKVINGFKPLGTVMDIQKKMKDDEFWGHGALQERIENQDKTLLDKHFYDLTYERGDFDLHEILYDLIEITDGVKIESSDSY